VEVNLEIPQMNLLASQSINMDQQLFTHRPKSAVNLGIIHVFLAKSGEVKSFFFSHGRKLLFLLLDNWPVECSE
jgi:hypothetical protein